VTTLLMLPMMLSPAVVGLFWKLLYDPSWGPINYALGIGKFEWLTQPHQRAVRRGHHRYLDVVAVRHAALARRPVGVPKHLYEAAAIDRASAWYTFRRITLPLVAPILLIALIFRTMEAFKAFDLPFVMSTASVADGLDPALSDGVPGLGYRQSLGARLHRADRGAVHHQHLRQVPQQGEGALRWLPSPPVRSVWASRWRSRHHRRGR
jgi:hypothetical protein